MARSVRRGVENAFAHDGSADALTFPDASFDLIVSNLGLNNFEHPEVALNECRRVARRGAQIALSTNLQGTFAELYGELSAALEEIGVADGSARVAEHVAARTTVDRTKALLARAGFRPMRVVEQSLRMRWATGDALIGHSFVRLAFRPAWEALAPEEQRAAASSALVRRLDRRAAANESIDLTVPLACVLARAT